MSVETYHIQADWDSEAGVWVATSEDVPGLATEADTIEGLTAKLRVIVPELLEANRLLPSDAPKEITFELTGHRQELIRLAS
jgi:predicted RNase H-like HicB family nuclease